MSLYRNPSLGLAERGSQKGFMSVIEITTSLVKKNYPLILPEDFTPHWLPGLTNEQYHADKTSVSSTALKRILKSPLNFYSSHMLGFREEESDAFRFGSAFHMALLEPTEFQKMYVLQPEFKGTGSVAARAEWRESQKPGAVILKEDEYNDLLGMLNSVQRHNGACNILKKGESEVSGYFRDPETGIKCRIRPDFMHLGSMALLDVKTTRDVEATEFSKTMWNYRYDIQMYFYSKAIEIITGRRVKYHLYLAIEKKFPFECAVYNVDEMVLERGKRDCDAAMQKLKTCLDTDAWIGYQNKVEMISLPSWALREGI